MKGEFLDYIEDIADAMSDVMGFMENIQEYDDFAADKKTIYAVTRAIEIIGEAAKKIPDKIKTDYSQIPWKEMAGMRDKLIHEYFGVDTKRVWNTFKKDIPNLIPLIDKILTDFK
jgi:uncharacterized protein with HEPN domain